MRARRDMVAFESPSARVQARMQWPAATMTREDFSLHQKGLLLHRDYSLLPDPKHPLSRQDAPAGTGTVMVHSPLAIAETRSRASMPQLPSMQSWKPFRSEQPREPTALLMASARRPDEPWQMDLHRSFPRCTAHVSRDKAALAAERSSERWASRLAHRNAGHQMRPL